MIRSKSSKGQATLEFVLLAPLLFLFFLSIGQLAFTGYVSFAVQRAAFAISRAAAASDDPSTYNPYTQLGYCLSPLGQLNRITLATILATKCDIRTDGEKVHVQVIYPMPIWIPGVAKVFGQKLNLNPVDSIPMASSLESVFRILGKPIPDFSLNGLNLPYVHLISFSADTIDENSIGSKI